MRTKDPAVKIKNNIFEGNLEKDQIHNHCLKFKIKTSV